MRQDLKNKFRSIIDYHSKYEEPNSKGLKNVILQNYLNIEHNGVIRIYIWIMTSNFFENKPKYVTIYKHQTVFELIQGQNLSKEEFVEMFKFTEERFLNTKLKFDDGQISTIKELYPTGDHLNQEKILQTVQGAPDYILNLWKNK